MSRISCALPLAAGFYGLCLASALAAEDVTLQAKCGVSRSQSHILIELVVGHAAYVDRVHKQAMTMDAPANRASFFPAKIVLIERVQHACNQR